jgi:hypothetical protein
MCCGAGNAVAAGVRLYKEVGPALSVLASRYCQFVLSVGPMEPPGLVHHGLHQRLHNFLPYIDNRSDPSSERHRTDGTDFLRLLLCLRPLLQGPVLPDFSVPVVPKLRP